MHYLQGTLILINLRSFQALFATQFMKLVSRASGADDCITATYRNEAGSPRPNIVGFGRRDFLREYSLYRIPIYDIVNIM